VLKDTDLDVAFLRPRDATTKLDAIELKPRGRAPDLMEDVFVLGRLGRLESRATCVSPGVVRGVAKGPRPVYILTSEAVAGAQGCLAFDASGATLGVIVRKIESAPAGGAARGRGGAGGGGGAATSVLRPIEDVLDLATQAKTAKAPERKPAAESDDGEDEKGVVVTAPVAATGTATWGGLSDDDAHRLYYAAACSGDANLITAAMKKLALMDEQGKPDQPRLQTFSQSLGPWTQKNSDWVRSMAGDKPAATAYAKKALGGS
jgi:hypothetical protein